MGRAEEGTEGGADRQRELRESERRYRDLVQMSPEPILVARGESIVLANPAALAFLGHGTAARLVGMELRGIFAPEARPLIDALLRGVAEGLSPRPRAGVIRLDGTLREVELAAAASTDGEGTTVQLILHDITDRERSAGALVAGETRLKKAQAMAHVGNWEIDLTARTMWGSEEALRIYGMDPAVSTTPLASVQALAAAGDRLRMDTALRALLERGAAYDVEFRIHRASDGEMRHLHSRAERVLDAAGIPVGVVGVVQDITERKRTEDALRASEAMLRTTLYSIGDGVITAARDGSVARMNRAAEAMTGWTEAEARGKGIDEVFRLVDEETGAARPNPVLKAIADGATTSSAVDDALLSRDGTRRQVSCRAAPIRDAGGSAAGIVLVFDDETKERELEAQFRQAQKLEAVGRLAGGIAHDYNNMTAVILGYAEILAEELRPMDPLQASVSAISEAARRSAGLTRQLLAFARKQIIAPVPLDLNAAIAGLEKMLHRLIGEDIELTLRLAADLWMTRIDPTQVDQVIANLCTNARDAIQDTGTIVIETSNARIDEAWARDHLEAAAGEYVMIAFSDTGKGMDKATRARIFEPFFTTKPPGEGTGLGLATVFGIVKQNGGFITVTSEPGKGTTFRLHLPRFLGSAAASPEKGAETPLRGTETVLLVEDEEQLLNLSRTALQAYGYRVLAAASPGDALLLCEENAGIIDILVTDVVMPGMNGRELQERCAVMKPGIKVLFMSGYTADIVAHRGIVDEGVEFLPKPFTPQALARKLRAVLGPRGLDSAADGGHQ